jgi:hypothetical protein
VYPVKISDNGATFASPGAGIDVDSNNVSHIVWQKDDKIYYDNSDIPGTDVEVAVLSDISFARPHLAVDTQDNPHVVWLNYTGDRSSLFYKKGETIHGSVVFAAGGGLDLTPDNNAFYPIIDTNKLAEDNTWTDRVYVGWVESTKEGLTVKYKRTLPHIVLLFVMDGISYEKIRNQLGSVSQSFIFTKATTTFPPTTFSSQASLFTSVYPKTHQIPGDEWKDGTTPYSYMLSNKPNEPPNTINNRLPTGVKTLYEYMDQAGKSKAVLVDMYQKGVKNQRPDYYTDPIVIDWSTGTTNLAPEIPTYFSNLKNNDNNPNNDVADLVTVYILSHDHGIDKNTQDIVNSIGADTSLGDITKLLEPKYPYVSNSIWKDTILIVTSDHGMTDVIKDNDHAIEELEFSRELSAEFDVATSFTGDVYYDATMNYECVGENAEFDLDVTIYQCENGTEPPFIPFVKAAVLSCDDSNDETWSHINTNSFSLGEVIVDIDYSILDRDDFTLNDLRSTGADVLILSTTDFSTTRCDFASDEINAIISYVNEGHGILGTGGTLYGSPELADLFGINASHAIWPDAFDGNFSILQPSHPIFNRFYNETYDSSNNETLSHWNIEDPDARVIGISEDLNAGIIVNEEPIYRASYLTHVPEGSDSDQDLQLIYNALVWLGNPPPASPPQDIEICNSESASDSKSDHLGNEFHGSGTRHKSGYANIDRNLHLEFGGMICSRTEEVYLNGELAYYYSDKADPIFRTDILPAAQDLYYSIYLNRNSSIYRKIDRILLKDGSTYWDYFGGNLCLPTVDESIRRLASTKTGDFILFSNIEDKYYFQIPHKSIYGTNNDLIVPLIIAGPGFEYFDRGGNNQFASLIDIVDIGPTIAYLAGGNNTVKLMSGVEGRNIFEPEFTVSAHSPVNLHLYDSKGRHTGPDITGKIETEIPTSAYRVLEDTDSKEITLLQASDGYRIEVEAYNAGKFTLKLEKNTEKEKYVIEYPEISIIGVSKATLDLINSTSYDLQFDYEGDNTFETSISPELFVKISEDELNNSAVVNIVKLPKNENPLIDTSSSTGTKLVLEPKNSISDEKIEIKKIFNNSLDSNGFTLGSYVNINFSESLTSDLKSTKLTIMYPDYLIIKKHLAEKDLSIYYWSHTGIKLNSTVDETLNTVSTYINKSGTYLIASSDQTPIIEYVKVIPRRINIPNTNVKIQSRIT